MKRILSLFLLLLATAAAAQPSIFSSRTGGCLVNCTFTDPTVSGTLTTQGDIVTPGTVGFANNGVRAGGVSIGRGATSAAGDQLNIYFNGTLKLTGDSSGWRAANDRMFVWSSTAASNGTLDTSLSRISAGVVGVGSGTVGAANGHIALLITRYQGTTFASLPASPVAGMVAYVTDSSTSTWGDTIAGGGANKVLAFYNGTNWTVAGK